MPKSRRIHENKYDASSQQAVILLVQLLARQSAKDWLTTNSAEPFNESAHEASKQASSAHLNSQATYIDTQE